jgi:hypothetical protein
MAVSVPAMPAAGASLHQLVATFRKAEATYSEAILTIDRYGGQLCAVGVEHFSEAAERALPQVKEIGDEALDIAEACGHMIAATPAQDVAGILAKLDMLAADWHAQREFSEALLTGAVEDIRRLSGITS